MDILLCGASGQMGKTIAELAGNRDDINIVCGISETEEKGDFPIYDSFDKVAEKVDGVIDFSSPVLLPRILEFSVKRNVPAVIATTGHSNENTDMIKNASRVIPILFSGNMSLGINVMEYIVKKMAETLTDFDIEIVEKHHNLKKDSPSGTAKMLFNAANAGRNNQLRELDARAGFYEKRDKNEVGISAVRAGNIVGEHTVIFAGTDEVLEIKHTAFSKKIFANGALKAMRFLVNQSAGLYNMSECLQI